MEQLLRDILKEVRNLSYLFFAFGVIWTLLFAYLWSLARRERDLRREIEQMRTERTGTHSGQDDE